MREYYFAFYVVVHILFSTGLSSCDMQQVDRRVQEGIVGKWQLIECEFANAADTSSVPKPESDIEFVAVGKNRYCTTLTHCYSYRIDSEFLYLLNKDSDHKCHAGHVKIYKYRLDGDRLQLYVLGTFFLKSAGHRVSFTYQRIRRAKRRRCFWQEDMLYECIA
ncbi:MAG: hypothetical protein LBP50_01885 [Tannerella sp.]|jgi:hypothetical protein|nr:hypothetical protein [Tannerella sp.]